MFIQMKLESLVILLGQNFFPGPCFTALASSILLIRICDYISIVNSDTFFQLYFSTLMIFKNLPQFMPIGVVLDALL